MALWTLYFFILSALSGVLAEDVGGLSQALSQAPQCAQTCLAKSIPSLRCEMTDIACICASQPFQQTVGGCLKQSCSIMDTLTATNLTQSLCGAPVRNRRSDMLSMTIAVPVVAGLFVIQRFTYKLYAKLPIKFDDWFSLISLCILVPISVTVGSYGVENGLGRDFWTLTRENINNFFRMLYMLEVCYFTMMCTIKLTLLFSYLRIFPAANVRRVIWGTIFVNCLVGVCFALLSIFQCRPISYYWHMWDGEHTGKCIQIDSIVWANAGVNISMDLWMLAIPLQQIRHLNLDWKKKAAVSAMFCVGTFVTIVSILRLHSLVYYQANATNPTWDYYTPGVWTFVEMGVGIICTCLPSLRLLLLRLFPKILGSVPKKYNSYTMANSASFRNKGAPGASYISSVTVQPNGTVSYPEDDAHQIACHKEYRVEYGDSDKIELVTGGHDTDGKSARSGPSVASSQ